MSTITSAEYRYERFELRHLLADMRFRSGSPAPGDRLPHLDLESLDGERIRHDDLDRPHLFIFGSTTCPMTASGGEPLARLHDRFGDAVRFVLVQVREAHPGEAIGQPATPEEKVAHARRLQAMLGVPFTVAVDDVDGSFHTSLDPKPNAAYLVDTDGTILFRSLWASDERGLGTALEAAVAGRRPSRAQSRRIMGPMLRSIGYVDPVLRSAGSGATRDVARSAPPMLLGARLASLFRGLPAQHRGRALLATAGALAVAVVAAAALLG